VLEFRCGWVEVVSVLQDEAVLGLLFFNYHNDARSNKHKINFALHCRSGLVEVAEVGGIFRMQEENEKFLHHPNIIK